MKTKLLTKLAKEISKRKSINLSTDLYYIELVLREAYLQGFIDALKTK